MPVTKLPNRAALLPALLQAGWEDLSPTRDALKKTYIFPSFQHAFSFMTRVALFSEKEEHHPEWFNVYNRVEITWSTHDCGGLSDKDLKAVRMCDEAAKAIMGMQSARV